MTKQEIALQLTLKILEIQGGPKLKTDISTNTELLERYSKKQAKLTSIIFNDLIDQLNCE